MQGWRGRLGGRSLVATLAVTGSLAVHGYAEDALTYDLRTEASVAESTRGPVGDLPFRLYQGMIVAGGSLSGVDKLRFLIDTGTTRTLVDRKLARRLGLAAAEPQVLLATVGGSGRAEQVILRDLKLGPVHIDTLPAVAGDLSSLARCGTQIDVVVGLDVLRSSSLGVNYKARRITFGPLAPSPRAVPFETTSPFLTVTVQVEGQPMRLMVDTGASVLALFEDGTQKRLPGLPWRIKGIQTATASSYVRTMQSTHVLLDHTEWSGQSAVLVKAPLYASSDLDGILAPAALGLTRLDFDFERHRLGWTANLNR